MQSGARVDLAAAASKAGLISSVLWSISGPFLNPSTLSRRSRFLMNSGSHRLRIRRLLPPLSTCPVEQESLLCRCAGVLLLLAFSTVGPSRPLLNLAHYPRRNNSRFSPHLTGSSSVLGTRYCLFRERPSTSVRSSLLWTRMFP